MTEGWWAGQRPRQQAIIYVTVGDGGIRERRTRKMQSAWKSFDCSKRILERESAKPTRLRRGIGRKNVTDTEFKDRWPISWWGRRWRSARRWQERSQTTRVRYFGKSSSPQPPWTEPSRQRPPPQPATKHIKTTYFTRSKNRPICKIVFSIDKRRDNDTRSPVKSQKSYLLQPFCYKVIVK